jgi:inhibitor of cysteine peptidase
MPATSFGEADNGKILQLATGTTFNVSLSENPTTGYSWNWTLTPGLELVNDSYAANTSGLMGAGGVHTWQLRMNNSSEAQTFTAFYKRPWEPVFGNETTYVLQIVAPGANMLPTDTGAGANTMPVSTNATMYTRANDNQTITVAKGETIAVMLHENPSTGYSWKITNSSGLTVKDLGFVTDPHPVGYVGVGGNHTWEVTATGESDQTFNGVYKRPWEPTFGNETTYVLKIKIS